MRSITATSALLLVVCLAMFTPSCKKTDCAAPTALTTSHYTNSSVQLAWTAASDAASYNLQYRLSGVTDWTTVNAVTSPYTLSGLTAGATYEWQLQTACSKTNSGYSPMSRFKVNSSAQPRLIFQFYFDSTQVRLNNFGQPSSMPAGHAGISPKFNKMSAHYIELAPTMYTALGSGTVLYRAPETSIGGASAIDFDSSRFAGQNEEFYSVPLSSLSAGTYEWLRVSLAYQNFDVNMLLNIPPFANNMVLPGTLASFVGYNSYIRNYKVKDSTVVVNANKLQGYWGFETMYSLNTGQAPATTVPNPIAATSPIPAGSCVVTGQFVTPFTITGTEDHDIVVKVSISTNKSFEFMDTNGNGQWDLNAAGGEQVVDMGVRGLIPVVQ